MSKNLQYNLIGDGQKILIKDSDNLLKTTWLNLKNLRDNSKLIPGLLYRITDYQCTTTQENTSSAGHQFDIILLALSNNKLAEEGWAMMHDNIYDVTFSDGVTKKCYILKTSDFSCNVVLLDTMLGYTGLGLGEGDDIEITSEEDKIAVASIPYTNLDEENTIYNYFQNSNLSAWKVWYCLDNDKSRFAWASDIEQLIDVDSDHGNGVALKRCPTFDGAQDYRTDYRYAWGCQEDIDDGDIMNFLYSKTESLRAGDELYYPSNDTLVVTSIGSITGKGVIYRLIDEFNNDIKYDFKNIQFKRTITDGQYNEKGDDTWCYTLNVWNDDMCQDASIVGNTLPNDEGYITGVHDNIFGYATPYNLYVEGVSTFCFVLENNVVLSFSDEDGFYYGIYSNTIGNHSYSNTIGNSFQCNAILTHFHNNIIGNNFFGNIIGDSFHTNVIGDNFSSNIVGNNCINNTIGNRFRDNMIGNGFNHLTISDNTENKNYGNSGVELATKDDLE